MVRSIGLSTYSDTTYFLEIIIQEGGELDFLKNKLSHLCPIIISKVFMKCLVDKKKNSRNNKVSKVIQL